MGIAEHTDHARARRTAEFRVQNHGRVKVRRDTAADYSRELPFGWGRPYMQHLLAECARSNNQVPAVRHMQHLGEKFRMWSVGAKNQGRIR